MKCTARLLVAALFLSLVLGAEAAPAKKSKKKKARPAVACSKVKAGPSGPFADVPPGHWAYEAISKAVGAGILQGWENKFHGNKVVNRYQMAVIVARMVDRMGVWKANGRTITAEDVANLESLVIEFADELAMLNVRINKAEDAIAGIRKDLDLIKAEMASGGVKSGISGVLSTRFVMTGNASPGWNPGSFIGSATIPDPAATHPLVRYRGGCSSGIGTRANPLRFDSRNFFTASNFSVSIDRHYDPHRYFHAQVDLNSEGLLEDFAVQATAGTGLPTAGRGENFASSASQLMVNEAYAVWEDWFKPQINGRLGIFALPMNTEVNGPGRTYLWTLTPSIANSKWESLRPVGLDIFQDIDCDELTFYVGFFTPGETAGGVLRSGTLLSSPTPFGATAQTDLSVNPAGAGFGAGRFPSPLFGPAMTDGPRGVQGQSLSATDIGFYGCIGTRPTKKADGIRWHLAYFDRNGDLRAGTNEHISQTDWYAWQASASYQWTEYLLLAQYYNGISKNYNTADGIIDARRGITTPFVNVGALDTDSASFMFLFNWQFCPKGATTVRFEKAWDETGLARLEAEVLTFAFNWKASDHSWLQAEYITGNSRSRSENGFRNTQDIEDDMFQVNYKLNW
ncbi:MAG: S-layer homology domain-containing protein [Candidatus Riflebacteria bacterium]|nr:S-layer homology domain-containing protein [Candidatus Riflebacteria bacterium]